MRPCAILLTGALLASCATVPKTAHAVPFALGAPAFSGGDAIVIDEIVGTRPRLEVGGVYLVSGRAKVRSHDGARIALYSTGADDGVRTRGDQRSVLPRGESEFRLGVEIVADGDLHLTLAPLDDEWSNDPFGGVYFRDPARPFLFGGVQEVAASPQPAPRPMASEPLPDAETPFDAARTDAERAADEAAFREHYLVRRERFADENLGQWLTIAGGRIFPVNECGTLAQPAPTMEAAVAAARAAVPQARHRFVFRVGEEGDRVAELGGCELPHVLGIEFLAALERSDVECRGLGPGQKMWFVRDGTRTEITAKGPDDRMFLRPEVGPPGAAGRADALFALSTGFGGGFAVLPPQTAAGASLHLWEIPGKLTMTGAFQSGECRRARARFRFAGTGLDFTVPVAIWPR